MTKVVAIESKIENKTQQETDAGIALQEASVDIWEKKYRLKSREGENVDVDIDDTYKRVARALADVEESEEKKEPVVREISLGTQTGCHPGRSNYFQRRCS